MGKNNFPIAGRTWNATTMAYQNTASKVQYVVIFDSQTGLILAYTESSPAQYTVRNLASVVGL